MVEDKRRLPVQLLVEWAFRDEKVTLDLPEAYEIRLGRGYGRDSLMSFEEQQRLGVRIDTFRGRSGSHEDAEVVAAIVANIPWHLGGRRMAVIVAELGRAGISPNWMPDETPRLVPLGIAFENQWGKRGKTAVAEKVKIRERVRDRTRRSGFRTRMVEHEVRYTPCTWSPDPRHIEAARRDYGRWWDALDWTREMLDGAMRKHDVNEAMPPREPWAARCGAQSSPTKSAHSAGR